MTEKLLQCPFCGSDADIQFCGASRDIREVICACCGTRGHKSATDYGAAASWNLRTQIKSDKALVSNLPDGNTGWICGNCNVVYKFSSKKILPKYCLECGTRIKETMPDVRVGLFIDKHITFTKD